MSSNYQKKIAVTGFCILLLASHCLSAQGWGALNVSGGDTYAGSGADHGKTVDQLITLAEADPGDSGGSCTSGAATFESEAETAFLQWKASDSNAGIQTMEIAAKWSFYQPTSSSANDACYTKFLTNVIKAYKLAGFKISFTTAVSSGPSWLANTTSCPNCLYKSQTGTNPKTSSGAIINLPNIVFSNQVRTLAGGFIDSAFTLATNAVQSITPGVHFFDLVRCGPTFH